MISGFWTIAVFGLVALVAVSHVVRASDGPRAERRFWLLLGVLVLNVGIFAALNRWIISESYHAMARHLSNGLNFAILAVYFVSEQSFRRDPPPR